MTMILRIVPLAAVLAAAALFPCAAKAQPQPEVPTSRARLATFDAPGGERYFALSITLESAPRDDRPQYVAILFDTSASQTGVFREDGLAALRQLLASLDAEDRVQLLAVDLQATPMTEAFIPPRGEAMDRAVAKLVERPPLGATDLPAAIEAAVAVFGTDHSPRTILYLGDGLSRANIVDRRDFAKLSEQLVNARASFTSFAIGPQRDALLLAAISAQSGGMLYLDTSEAEEAQRAGSALAEIVHRPVFWPEQSSWPSVMRDVFPHRLPPLRSDRDSVVLGLIEGDGPLAMPLELRGLGKQFSLPVDVLMEASSDDFAFLPQVHELARKEGELALPLLGSAGLREMRRLLVESARHLVQLGEQALASDDLDGAQRLAEAARKRDPGSLQVETLLNAIRAERKKQSPK